MHTYTHTYNNNNNDKGKSSLQRWSYWGPAQVFSSFYSFNRFFLSSPSFINRAFQAHTDLGEREWSTGGHAKLPTLDWPPDPSTCFHLKGWVNANFPPYRLHPTSSAVLLGPSGKLSYQRQFVEVSYLIGMVCVPHNISDEKQHHFLPNRISTWLKL